MREDGKPSLQLLERTFSILDVFRGERPEWTVTEIARASELPVTTVHRILSMLRRRGYVARDERTKRYRLGAAALDLGRRARSVLDLRTAALPVLRRLSRETDETALLCILGEQRDRSICLERVESSRPLRLSIEPGRQLPLHAGASQKALLAFLPTDEIEAILARPLERLSRGTITDPSALRAALTEVRMRGWAFSSEENDVGAWGVGVPLLDHLGGVLASLGLAGPTVRLSPAEVKDHVRRVRAGAVEIAETVGLPEPPLARGGRRARPARAREEQPAWR